MRKLIKIAALSTLTATGAMAQSADRPEPIKEGENFVEYIYWQSSGTNFTIGLFYFDHVANNCPSFTLNATYAGILKRFNEELPSAELGGAREGMEYKMTTGAKAFDGRIKDAFAFLGDMTAATESECLKAYEDSLRFGYNEPLAYGIAPLDPVY